VDYNLTVGTINHWSSNSI